MPTFESDPAKSRANKQRHGIDLGEAQALWATPHVIIPARLVRGEPRSAIVGKIRNKTYVAIFMQRGEINRLISCHRADRRWERIYAKYVEQAQG